MNACTQMALAFQLEMDMEKGYKMWKTSDSSSFFFLCYMRQIDACIGKRAHSSKGIKQKSKRSEIQTFEFAYLERAISKKEKQQKYVYRENKVVSLHYNGSAHNLREQASERTVFAS